MIDNNLIPNNLFWFFVFVVPGFIGQQTYALLTSSSVSDVKSQLYSAATYSCMYYVLLWYPILAFENSDFKNLPILPYLFYIGILIILPIILTYFWRRIRMSKIVQNYFPHPDHKPWKHVFKKRESYWVIIELHDGTIIGGLYSEKSFTSSEPAKEQIYLEETWKLNNDGGFDEKKQSTKGIIVSASEMKYIEFFEYEQCS